MDFVIEVRVSVDAEDGDTVEGLTNYVDDLATEWIRDDVIYTVRRDG